MLIKELKNEYVEECPDKSHDGKLFITGLVGGAVALYVSMFIFKYRTKNLFLMIVMPILSVFNIYMYFLLFRFGSGYILR